MRTDELDELTNDEEHDLLIEALEELKTIVNCASNGEPLTVEELTDPESETMRILNRAYEGGIRLNGEIE